MMKFIQLFLADVIFQYVLLVFIVYLLVRQLTVMIIRVLLILVAVFGIAVSLSEVANFPVIVDMKSGEHKLTLRTLVGPSLTNLSQSYRSSTFQVVFDTPPYVAIGLLVYEALPTNGTVDYYVYIKDIKQSYFISQVTVSSGTTINQLRYMYLAFPKDTSYGEIHFIDDYENLTEFTGTINTKTQTIHDFNQTYPSTHQHIFLPFLVSFGIEQANNQYSVRVQTEASSQKQFKTTVESNSTLMHVNFFVIHVDRTVLTETVLYFLDYGYNLGIDNTFVQAVFNAPISSFNYYNYIQGANWISLETQQTLSVNFNGNPDPLSSLGTYKYARSNMLHWRKRDCTDYTYYLDLQSKCYDQCPVRYANNDTYNFCEPCHYSCLNCLTDGTTCTECSPTNDTDTKNDVFRDLINGTCLCFDGYFDSGVEICEVCDYTCLTCQTSSTFCLTCDSTRDLINGSCLCQQRKFDPHINDSFCESCDYTCFACKGSSTNCTQCSSNSNRQLTLDNRCLCSSGFSAASGVQICTANPALVCDVSCKTCENSSTKCTTCYQNVNRAFNSSAKTCKCITGYESVNNAKLCTEICGDGKMYEDQCDDGNTVDGDGCSSSCTIENNYKCDNSSQPSICIYQLGYAIKIQSLVKDKSSNIVYLRFTIIPPPPSNVVPSIQIQSSSSTPVASTSSEKIVVRANLVTVSYVLDGSDLNMTLQYSQSIPQFTYAKLSLGDQVGKSEQFQVVDDEGLALNYYAETTYTLYDAQNILIWVMIGIAWLSAIVLTIVDKHSILKIVELFMSVGIAWIGSMGLFRYLIYYEPLINLRYFFGYNEIIADEDGLLAYVNYCLIFNLLPSVIFLVMMILIKVKNISVTQYMKKFLLFELTYAWFCFNSIIVMFGLFTETFTETYSTPLSIGSLFLGIFYLICWLLMSIMFIKNEESFVYMKSEMNLEKRKGPIYFFSVLTAKLACVLAYLFVGYYKTDIRKYTPLIFMGLTLTTMIIAVIIKPYTNIIRVLLNEFCLFLVFSCYFLIKEVQNAEWSGFAIVIILYIQVLLNIVSMALSARQNLKKYDFDQDEAEEGYASEMQEPSKSSSRKGDEIGDFRFIDPRTQQKGTSVKKSNLPPEYREYLENNSTIRNNFQIQRY